LFINPSKNITIEMYGITTKYLVFNIDKTTGSKIVDCAAKYSHGAGCFTYNQAVGTQFVRCEAARCQYSTYGDGFNGHGYTVGDVFGKQTTVTLEDCWSHDNNDDGFSDHDRCETVIRGGLFEFNGKAGITPSYGDHCACFAVISRYNYAGFYLIGTNSADEGGKYAQMLCVDCVAIENTRGGEECGFIVSGTYNKMILINCKAIGNTTGYYADAYTGADMYDCTAKNNTNNKDGSGTFRINNTELVS
jgi:hypothetical protein